MSGKRSHASTAVANAAIMNRTETPSLDVVASLPEYAPSATSRETDLERRRAQRDARKVRQAARRRRGRR